MSGWKFEAIGERIYTAMDNWIEFSSQNEKEEIDKFQFGELRKSGFVELVNLDFGKYKNVSHYGFNAVCKEKQYDWVCYMVIFGSVYNWIRNKRYVF